MSRDGIDETSERSKACLPKRNIIGRRLRQAHEAFAPGDWARRRLKAKARKEQHGGRCALPHLLHGVAAGNEVPYVSLGRGCQYWAEPRFLRFSPHRETGSAHCGERMCTDGWNLV